MLPSPARLVSLDKMLGNTRLVATSMVGLARRGVDFKTRLPRRAPQRNCSLKNGDSYPAPVSPVPRRRCATQSRDFPSRSGPEPSTTDAVVIPAPVVEGRKLSVFRPGKFRATMGPDLV